MYYTPYHAPDGFDWVVRLEDWFTDANTLHLNGRSTQDRLVELVLSALSPYVWRMRMTIPGAKPEASTPILVNTPLTAPRLAVHALDGFLSVNGAELTLRVDKDPFCLRFLDADGREICRENPYDIDGLGRPFILPLGFVADGDSPLITETFHLRQDEHLFGLGEKFTPLDKRGQRIISWTQDAFGSTSERSHKNIPFLMSTRGCGLLLDTGARITWELGTVSAQSYTMMLEGTSLDAYLIYGPTPAAILERYLELTGCAPVPPKWSFGLWLSGSGKHRDRASIEKLVAGAEQRALPVDVVHVDTWWMKWRMYANFRFDPEAFPDVDGFIADLHHQGLRLSLWEQPYISIESDLFELGKANGYFVRRPDGAVYIIDYGLSLAPRPDGIIRTATPETSWNAPVAIIDLTNPEATVWFQNLHRPLLQMGVDVFKTDFGEDVPADALFANGATGATMHNLYPLLYNQAVSEVVRQEQGYSLVWSRSGTAGNQRYPVCWSGDPGADWDSLACTIRGGLSIGMSGVPFWSSDIGGYRGMPSPELYIRWAQFTLFCSHARMHGDSPREPWVFGDQALDIVRRFVQLRYALFPYLYSTAHEASRSGLPVIRAMPLAFPEDPNTYDKDLQYMLGAWLLVAPIYTESDERTVYLPAGKWVDYWTNQVYHGETNIRVHAPLDTMPLFVRGGAIIPKAEAGLRIPNHAPDPLIVDIYPYGESAYTLFEDEGEIHFRCHERENSIMLEWKGSKPRRLILNFRSTWQDTPVISGALCENIALLPGILTIHTHAIQEASLTITGGT